MRYFLIFGLIALAGCGHRGRQTGRMLPALERVPVVAPSSGLVSNTGVQESAAVPRQDSVTPPAPASPDPQTLARIDELLGRFQDVYFNYDQQDLRPDAIEALRADARTLSEIIRHFPNFHLIVEGHADERGSSEYNLALGDARARRARQFLIELGLPEAQMETVSYGKLRPVCTDENEACWQQNRRAHLARTEP